MILLSLTWIVNPNINLISKIYYYVKGLLYERFVIENIFCGWNRVGNKWSLGGSNEPPELAPKKKNYV